MVFASKKQRMILREKIKVRNCRSFVSSRSSNDGKTDKNVPAAPIPKRAMLITRNAKWYHWATESILVKDTCSISIAMETANTQRWTENC
jgi:hypothetical protein